MNLDLNAAVAQLTWTPLLVILLGIAILSEGATRVRFTAAAIGGATVMGVVLFALAVAS